jgi:hypothetical protein
MGEKPLSAIQQSRTLPPFKGNFSITFTLNNINRQINNFHRIDKGFEAVPVLLDCGLTTF